MALLEEQEGMNILAPVDRRDLFAAAALQGLLGGRGSMPPIGSPEGYRNIAGHVVGFADALLAALDQQKEATT